MLDSSLQFKGESIPAAPGSGLAARALLGWMDRDEAVRFLIEDCLFPNRLTSGGAEEIWESRKAIVETLAADPAFAARKLPLSGADIKAAKRFRSWHPNADSVVDFVRLNPMDLVVHQLWVSTDIADRYRDSVTPDKWLHTALLDPPTNSRLRWRREGDTVLFDLPHFEYFLAGPSQPDGQMRVSEADCFVTVALHADRALLMRGYHRTYACAQGVLDAVNAPHGVLFGVSNALATMGNEADEILSIMQGPRPPRVADFFDDRLFLAVTLRRRQYRMKIRYEVVEVGQEEPQAAPATSPEPDLNAVRNVQLLCDHALRHYKAGRIDEAVVLYERVVFLKPDYADAHSNLGVAFVAQGKLDAAVEHYERALAIDPGHVGAHNNLAAALAKQGRMDEAVTHYRHVLAIDSNNAEAHNDLGNVLQMQGKLDEAMALYGRAIAIKPAYAEAHLNRAEIKTFRFGDPDLAGLQALAGRNGLLPDEALRVHFALAKALEDCGDYDHALEHWRKGNSLKRARIDYDEQGFAKLFQSIARVFDRDLFDRFQGEGDPSSVPVFVLGMPRSGSSLIEQILASHPQVHGAGELEDLEKLANSIMDAEGKLLPYPECVPGLDGVALRRLGQAYLSHLPAVPDGKTRIVDKLPINFINIGLIRLILPNARIIHTTRDPLDTCFSCYSRLFTHGQQFCYDLAELGRHFRRYADLMCHWRSVLPQDAMLDVSYEEVVDDLEGQARRLVDFCGLEWDDRCLDFHRNARIVRTASAVQVRKPLFRSSVQRWRRFEAGLGPLLQELGEGITASAATR